LVLPSSRQGSKPLTSQRARQILSAAGQAAGLSNFGAHSFRKTFGYRVCQRSGGNLGLVKKLLKLSSSGDALRCIGLSRERTETTFPELNSG
jgi:integrase